MNPGTAGAGQAGVPAQHGLWGDDQAQLAELAAGKQPGQRGQDRPVSPGQSRGVDLALEHGDLMTQQEDLGVLGAVRAGEQSELAKDTEHHQVGKSS